MEINIFDYGMNGEGVAKVDGKVILCANALIDEVVEAEIIEDNKNFAVAKTKQILKTSKMRSEPKCPYFTICGGCDLQHMEYNEQLKFKQKLVQKTIKKICNLDVQVLETIPSSKVYNYRNKMSFTVNDKLCGLYKAESKNIVDITSCPLAQDDINIILNIFKGYINNNPNTNIKNIVIREIENQILVGVVTKAKTDLSIFIDALKLKFKNIGVYEIINTRKDSVVLSGKINHIYGIKEIKINNFNLTYYVDLIGFHQTNIDIQNKIYQKVLNYINPNTIIVNGFSGQGLLSAILASKAKQVYGIEINNSSHISAEKLKTDNNISNLTNICGDFNKHINHYIKIADTIILDPAKKGCGIEVMKKIKGIKNIIYISCNPIALCKDLNVLKDDYIIEEITPFDMFPTTKNVETLVKLKIKD